jgi:hypothetical protein
LYIDSGSGRETDLRNSTIHGNQSPQGNGGGIWNRTEVGDYTTLSNVTVAQNHAGGGNGGGFYHAAGRAVIASSTIVYNTSSAGGGIFNEDLVTNDSLRLRNTLLADNGGSGNCSGLLTSQGYNLDSGVSCALAGAGDISNGVADLDSLSPPDPMAVLSGDITPSYALLGGSQALNAGNPAACYDARNIQNNDLPLPTDQRGEDRVQQGRCDIGSVESQAPTAVTLASLQTDAASPTSGWGWPVAGFALLAGLGLAAAIARSRQRAASTRPQ